MGKSADKKRASKSPAFPKERPAKVSILETERKFDLANLMMARVFLQEPERYAGIQIEWALMFVARMKRNRAPRNPTLFD